MKRLLSTREVAEFIGVNEKMVYALISDKGLPATKITGKWLFPTDLVEQWIENHTLNFPKPPCELPAYEGLLIIMGSNDPLLERTISLFNAHNGGHVAVFGNLGSMGGLKALRRKRCHMAGCHLLQENSEEYNFDFASQELEQMPAVVNFCRREQGLLVARGNPLGIESVKDLARPGLRLANRPLGTGTRHLLDRLLAREGIRGEKIDGYENEQSRHLDVGLEILSGRCDVGPGIRAVAGLLNIGFIPLRWERYDLMIDKQRFFDEGIQRFLGMLHEPSFKRLSQKLTGYDLAGSGKMVYPGNATSEGMP
jgi:putative molybdopterin biosynthesis protein